MGYGRVERRGSSSGLPSLAGSLHVVRRTLTNRTTTTGSGCCAESEAAAILTKVTVGQYVKFAGLDEMVESFPPAQAIRALSLHDHRFRIAVPSDVDAERRLAVAGEDRRVHEQLDDLSGFESIPHLSAWAGRHTRGLCIAEHLRTGTNRRA